MTATLVDHLWQSTLFAIGAAALAIMFRNHGAAVRYWIWFAASAKFLVPFAALTAMGRSLGVSGTSADLSWAQALTHPMSTFVVTPVDGSSVTEVLLLIWGFGSALVAAFWLLRWLELNDEMRGAKTVRISHLVGCGVEVRETFSIGPGVVGFFRPVLVLPHFIRKRLAPEHLRPVLQHELAHLRRQDNLTAVVHMLVETVFWFHPLVWLIGARLIDERERACDEFVIASGVDPEIYAEGILAVCRAHVESPLPCAAGVSRAALKARIAEIMGHKGVHRMTRRNILLLASAALASIVAPVLLGALTAKPAAAQANALEAGGAELAAVAPLVRVPPEYPPEAIAGLIEGWVELEFTITVAGTVKDAVVIESSPPGVFDDAALRAVARWRYNPRVENGQPIARPNIKARIAFQLTN